MTASTLSLSAVQALASTTVVSTGAGFLAWASPFTAVGFPASVMFMALTGSAAGLIHNAPGGSRARMFSLVFVYTMVAAALAIVLGEIPGFTFFRAVAPATALLIAFFAQALLPVFKDAIVKRIERTVGGAK